MLLGRMHLHSTVALGTVLRVCGWLLQGMHSILGLFGCYLMFDMSPGGSVLTGWHSAFDTQHSVDYYKVV